MADSLPSMLSLHSWKVRSPFSLFDADLLNNTQRTWPFLIQDTSLLFYKVKECLNNNFIKLFIYLRTTLTVQAFNNPISTNESQL